MASTRPLPLPLTVITLSAFGVLVEREVKMFEIASGIRPRVCGAFKNVRKSS